jgi:hypothetical protein
MKFTFLQILSLFLCFSAYAAEEKINVSNSPSNVKQNSQQIEILQSQLDSAKVENEYLKKLSESTISEFNILRQAARNQTDKINLLTNSLNESNFQKEFVYPIILSIISAFIFWLAFSYLPELRKKRKMREKLDLNLYQIQTGLFSIFDLIMRYNKHSPSSYQKEIKANSLTQNEINLGIQNKCLNETYLFDSKVNHTLMAIGEKLYERTKAIDQTIERSFNFFFFLSSHEILLLEKIRTILYTYDLKNFKNPAKSIVAGQELCPVNPSISYMTNNLSTLFEHYVEIKKIVHANKFESREVFLDKIQTQYYSGNYQKCLRLIRKSFSKFPNDKRLLICYKIQSLYKLKKIKFAQNELITLLSEKPNLVSSRDFIKIVYDHESMRNIIQEHYTSEEIDKYLSVINKESERDMNFIKSAESLRKYYSLKSKMITEMNKNT